jgi:hypothetical protein
MKPYILPLAALCALNVCAGRAAGAPWHSLEGAWIWDPALFEVPGTWNRDDFPMRETMQVAHDDGRRFVARTEQDYSDGTRYRFVEDLAEDGALHKVSNGSSATLWRLSRARMAAGGWFQDTWGAGRIRCATCRPAVIRWRAMAGCGGRMAHRGA